MGNRAEARIGNKFAGRLGGMKGETGGKPPAPETKRNARMGWNPDGEAAF